MPLTDAFLLVLAFMGYIAATLILGSVLLVGIETLIRLIKR